MLRDEVMVSVRACAADGQCDKCMCYGIKQQATEGNICECTSELSRLVAEVMDGMRKEIEDITTERNSYIAKNVVLRRRLKKARGVCADE